MLVESMGTAVLVGKIRGGKLNHLLDITIQRWCLFIIASLIEFAASWVKMKEIDPLYQWVDRYTFWIHGFVYILLFITILSNIRSRGFLLICIGVFLNFVVIAANGGKMPVAIPAVEGNLYQQTIEMLKAGKDFTHTLMEEPTRFKFLGDIIHIPKPYPMPKSLSIGDIFMMVGVFLFIQSKMLGSIEKNTSE
ncbi:MAG: DUF5317 domain-containing protein [Bacillota bacterium]